MSDPNDARLRSLVRELVEAGPPPPPLPTPPRHRSRWRTRAAALSAAGVLVVAAAASLAYVTANREGGHHPTVRAGPSASPNNYVVIDSGYTQSTFVDFATGASHTVTFPNKAAGDYPYSLFATDGSFVYPGGGGAMAVPTTLDRAPRLLGTGGSVIPSSTPGRVWLITANLNGAPVRIGVQEVGVNGDYRSPTYHLPGGSGGVIAAVDGGLIVARVDKAFVWYPATNKTGPTSQFIGSEFIDVHGSLMAWGRDCTSFNVCSSVEVFNVAGGSSRTYPAPAGTAGWVSTAGEGSHNAFAPDGRRLAIRAALTPGAPNTPPASRAYVLDLATGAITLVPGSEALAYSRLAWTPHDQWVLFENDTHTMGAYRVTDATSRTLLEPCCGVALLAIPR